MKRLQKRPLKSCKMDYRRATRYVAPTGHLTGSTRKASPHLFRRYGISHTVRLNAGQSPYMRRQHNAGRQANEAPADRQIIQGQNVRSPAGQPAHLKQMPFFRRICGGLAIQ